MASQPVATGISVPPESPREHVANALQGLQFAIATPFGNRYLPADEYDSIVARLRTALAQLETLRLHTIERQP